MAMERISFHKFPDMFELECRRGVCELEHRLGVYMDTNYPTESSARSFTHFIAQVQQKKLGIALQQTKFFSILLDNFADLRNIKNELLMVV